MLGEKGVLISHQERSDKHEHSYINALAGEFCSHVTTESLSGKSRHRDKLSKDIKVPDKMKDVFTPNEKLESVHDVASAYRYCDIECYCTKLVQNPIVRKRTLYFGMESKQQVMPPSSFKSSDCLVGVVMKKGWPINVLIKVEDDIKRISDANFNKKIQRLFSIF